MEHMSFVVLVLSKLQASLSHSIKMNWQSGCASDKQQREVLMEDLKKFQMCAIHGGYSAAYASSTEETGLTKRHWKDSLSLAKTSKVVSAIGQAIQSMSSILSSD